MPLNSRSIATMIAVLTFFTIGFMGLFYHLTPYTCSKRAVIGALAAYIGVSWIMKAVNAILTQAIISNWIQQQEQQQRGHQD